MKQLLTLILLLGSFVGSGQKSFVPSSPYPVLIKQSDGSELILYAGGDENIHYPMTEDGYTVIKNEKGDYEYAQLDAADYLIPSGILAKNQKERQSEEFIFLDQTPKHLKPAVIETDGMLKSARERVNFPSSGVRKSLLLLIQYPNLPASYSVTEFGELMNQPDYKGSGSFRDYFLDCSDGSLDISTDVYGWFTAANNYEYYGENQGDDRARQLVAEAIDAAEQAGVDFSLYDNNGDGYVDNLIVAHSGPGAEEGSQTQYIWSHSWYLKDFKYYDGVYIGNYIMQPETRSYGMVGIGVFCHEFGHVLGLPDLYDRDFSSSGLGNWCLMSTGSWLNYERTPALMSAWCRETLGWITPTVISWPVPENSYGEYTLQPAALATESYKILTPNSNEYFLLENKYKVGFNAALPGSGLAIFHVNTSRTNNDNENAKLVDLEEADGRNDLDRRINRGDSGDLFPGSSGNTAFDDFTNPDAKTDDTKLTGINIQNITQDGMNISFSLVSPSENGPNLTYVPSKNKLTIQDNTISFELEVINDGKSAAPSNILGYYLSTDPTITTNDYLLAQDIIYSLDPDKTAFKSKSVLVPSALPELPEGIYYAGYIIDKDNHVAEVNKEDNTFCFSDQVYKHCNENSTIFHESICDGEVFHFEGNAFAEQGYYEFIYSGWNGCDSLVVLDLTVNPRSDTTLFVSVCQGESYQAGNETFSETGNYQINLTNRFGCDSLVVLNLEVLPVSDTLITAAICEGQTLSVAGREFSTHGIHETVLTNQFGCDSLVVLDLTVNPLSDTTLFVSVCQGESYQAGNETFSETGNYQINLTNRFGCDSLVVLNLEVLPVSDTLITKEINDGDTIFIGSSVYTHSGVYTDYLTNSFGCDSIVILNLSVKKKVPVLTRKLETSTFTISVYPNPAMERLNIKVENLVGDYAIQLISVDGKVITNRLGKNTEYQFIEQIVIEEFSSGIYSVIVKSDGISVSKRVVIRGYR